MSIYRAPGAEEYAKKTVKDDRPTTGDWVNIAHDYSQGYLAALKSTQDEQNSQLPKALDRHGINWNCEKCGKALKPFGHDCVSPLERP